MANRAGSVSDSFTTLQSFTCEGGCFGDSRTSVPDEVISKSPVTEKDFENVIAEAISKPLISASKVIHIDITPDNGEERTEEKIFCDSGVQHIHEIRVFDSKVAIENTISLEATDHDSNKNTLIPVNERLLPLNITAISCERRAGQFSDESNLENARKCPELSNPPHSANEAILQKKPDSKFLLSSAKWEHTIDASLDVIKSKVATKESFAQTEAWNLKMKRKSNLKRNLQELFFSCAGCCI